MKLLFIFEYLSSFRVDVLNELSKRYEVTVIHSGYRGGQKTGIFKEEIVPMIKVGPFRWQYDIGNLSGYGVVICMFDLAMPTYLRLIFGKREKNPSLQHRIWIFVARGMVAEVYLSIFRRSNSLL